MKIIDSAFRIGNKLISLTKHHSPTIMLIGGSVAVIAGGILACKETLKADEVIDIHRSQLEKIDIATEEYSDDYTSSDRTRDLIQVYCGTAGRFAKLYAPAALLEVAGFAAIFAGFGIIKKRYGLALSTIATLDKKISQVTDSFLKYRGKVIDEYGQEVDSKFLADEYPIKEIEKTVVDEDGNETVEKRQGLKFNVTNSDFTRVFDAYNDKWQGNPLLDENFLTQVQDWYTLQLQKHRFDHVFMNTIDRELAFEESGIGHFYGWTDKSGCGVNFNILPVFKMFAEDEDGQFPMLVPVESEQDYEDFKQMVFEDEDYNQNATKPGDKQSRVGYLINYNVDCDENGVPHEIYNEVYGTKQH